MTADTNKAGYQTRCDADKNSEISARWWRLLRLTGKTSSREGSKAELPAPVMIGTKTAKKPMVKRVVV